MEEKQPLFYRSAVSNGISGITAPGAGQTQELSCACPSKSASSDYSQRSNLQSPIAEKGQLHGEWFSFFVFQTDLV